MLRDQFAGASKTGSSLLSPLERRMARHVLPRVPAWLGTQHLTMLTLAWSALAVLSGYLARGDRRWLYASSLAVACQYVTDHFDGKVGKYRGTGLVKWGYYMDHLLDYLFLASVLLGYAFLLPERSHLHLFLVLAVFAGFMVNSFLTVAAAGRFHVSHLKFGPTEFRVALVVTNVLLVQYGTRGMEKALPYVAAGGFLMLCALAYNTHREIWRLDMAQRRLSESPRGVVVTSRREAA